MDTPGVSQVAINAGGFHTVILTYTNEVYTWGHNRCGQLGYYSDGSNRMDESIVSPSGPLPRNFEGALFSPTPRRLFLQNSSIVGKNAQVARIAAGWGHTAILLSDGSLFMCGRNESGQLGMGVQSNCKINERGHHYQDRLCLLTGEFEVDVVRDVICGGEHSLLVCENSDLYGTGSNKFKQLGCSTNLKESIVEKFTLLDVCQGLSMAKREVLQIACRNTSSLILFGKHISAKSSV